MFSGFDSNKKREKNRKEPAIELGTGGPATQPQAVSRGAFSTGQDPRDMGGVTIQEFSRTQKIPEPEAWRMLRRGELVGRTFEGRLYVFTNVQDSLSEAVNDELATRINELIDEDIGTVSAEEAVTAPAEETYAAKEEISAAPAVEDVRPESRRTDLPPLPGSDESSRAGAAAADSAGFLPVPSERITNTEIALLLDHLSLAKEENREILKMTQESIRKVTELTDTIVEMKDSMIDAKESQIMFLKDQLETKEKEIRKLLQQKEDLEILTQTIMTHQK